MKLLIVEDEAIAREGLRGSLRWEEYGIESVVCAENGEAGLRLARRSAPDIVLTDIRMPRMDGITMATRLREAYPDCRIIFLSAYSDIEYYKAAIQLKAVRFLDKPVQTGELVEVIRQAVDECAQIRSTRSLGALHDLHERMELADALCQGADLEELTRRARALGLGAALKKCEVVTALLLFCRSGYDEGSREDTLKGAQRLGALLPQENVHTVRQDGRLVYFLFTPAPLSDFVRANICQKVELAFPGADVSIVFGGEGRGLGGAAESYATAKRAAEKAYCFPFGEPVVYSERLGAQTGLFAYDELRERILQALGEKDEAAALAGAQALFEALRHNQDLPYAKARELYYGLLSEVFRLADQQHLPLGQDEPGDEIFWAVRIEAYDLRELDRYLQGQLRALFAAVEQTRSEKRQILTIKDYIADHYPDPALSVSSISRYLHMSASHVCTLFKKETGETINGYLTEYRLERAKKYLDESLLSIADVGAKIGYKDNSYFGRIFRKHVGMTPLEYRNRIK